MSLNKNNLVKLAKTVARANPSSPVAYSYGEDKFSYSELNFNFVCKVTPVSCSVLSI